MSACSKAPRGLSVLSRVIRIFTYTSISPDPLLRQCPNRYTFRAGRNLPDKEFRYLRTVIVTAAVYWGLSSSLHVKPSLNLPAPGRCQPPIIIFRFSRYLCFGKQSLGPGPAATKGFRRFAYTLCGTFSRSYGVILPSSLTKVLPRVLEFSSRLPVSVCGTGENKLDSIFSWQCGIGRFVTFFTPITSVFIDPRIYLGFPPTGLDMQSLHARRILLRQHVSQTLVSSTGMSTCCPSTTPFGLALGPDLP